MWSRVAVSRLGIVAALSACNIVSGADGVSIVADPADRPADQGSRDDTVGGAGAAGGAATEGGGGALVSANGGAGGVGIGGQGPNGGNGQQPPILPVYRISLRVHVGTSNLSAGDMKAMLDEVNWIWWSQAAICFEIETVTHDDLRSDGFDLFIVASISGVNGYYAGDHDIWTQDYPSLSSSPNPTDHPVSRTSAHELGHGLTLNHYNGFSDSNNSLMSSGTKGWALHADEVAEARARASEKALPDMSPIYCSPL